VSQTSGSLRSAGKPGTREYGITNLLPYVGGFLFRHSAGSRPRNCYETRRHSFFRTVLNGATKSDCGFTGPDRLQRLLSIGDATIPILQLNVANTGSMLMTQGMGSRWSAIHQFCGIIAVASSE